jgi:hypothetical protein
MKKRGLSWGCCVLEILGDIKGPAKLAAMFCSHKQVKPRSEVFRRCSVFRGMALDRPAQQPCSA